MNNLALRPPLEDESPLQQTPIESSLLDRLILPTIAAGRPVANIPPTNDMHPIAIAMPLIVPAALFAAFSLTLAGSELYLIPAVSTLTVVMLFGLITACGVFAHKVEPQIATIPVAVAIGSTLILACAAATHG